MTSGEDKEADNDDLFHKARDVEENYQDEDTRYAKDDSPTLLACSPDLGES